ncbi:hypothetical protein BB559_006190 [Furculomyces boomerangus]|uniref:Glycolipid transfer protein domain-containing protein n=2 Tax=Harpellales TaxID=61421 RepID=A0A2T9Y481_9FUNG|nr:hypothetical protein BB559_006190 [Furculomyces boomerangus]PWA02420.1 hypothetical protein BB558_001436 [Smittium angustum]
MSEAAFLDRVPFRFENVKSSDEGIDTEQFLEASKGVVMLFDELGSAAFSPVKSDITGNITKVYTKYNTDKQKFNTLEKIVLDEASSKDKTATQGLLWLKRGLEFCALAIIKNIQNVTEELSQSFTNAYNETLKQYHNFLIKPIFLLAMKACPTASVFYSKIGSSPTLKDELLVWAKALKAFTDRLDAFYKKGSYDKGL